MKLEPVQMSAFHRMRSINVNDHTEKKNGLTYLSWAWAVDQLLQNDPSATWEYPEPLKFGDTLMVRCSVTAFGKTMTAQLPVMDHRNKAIPNPDSFQVNVGMQRCLAKAIALHGLGLYIYAGEDLPEGAESPLLDEFRAAAIEGSEALNNLWKQKKSEKGFADFWKEHGQSLKKAAQEADNGTTE